MEQKVSIIENFNVKTGSISDMLLDLGTNSRGNVQAGFSVFVIFRTAAVGVGRRVNDP